MSIIPEICIHNAPSNQKRPVTKTKTFVDQIDCDESVVESSFESGVNQTNNNLEDTYLNRVTTKPYLNNLKGHIERIDDEGLRILLHLLTQQIKQRKNNIQSRKNRSKSQNVSQNRKLETAPSQKCRLGSYDGVKGVQSGGEDVNQSQNANHFCKAGCCNSHHCLCKRCNSCISNCTLTDINSTSSSPCCHQCSRLSGRNNGRSKRKMFNVETTEGEDYFNGEASCLHHCVSNTVLPQELYPATHPCASEVGSDAKVPESECEVENFTEDFDLDQKIFYVYSHQNMYSVVLNRLNPCHSERINPKTVDQMNDPKCPLIKNNKNLNNLESMVVPTIIKEIQKYLDSPRGCCCNTCSSSVPCCNCNYGQTSSQVCFNQSVSRTEEFTDTFIDSLQHFLEEVRLTWCAKNKSNVGCTCSHADHQCEPVWLPVDRR